MKPTHRANVFRPRLETLETRALLSVVPPAELSEGNAVRWTTFADDGRSATIRDDSTFVMVGNRSLRFDTQSAAATGIRLQAGAQPWNLTSFAQFEFWTYSINTNSAGFKGAQPVIVLTTTSGTYRYTPRNQGAFLRQGWDKHHVSLSGDAFWTRAVTGSPNLAQVTGLEIRQETHGAGFTIYYDGMSFTRTNPTPTVSSSATVANATGAVASPRVLLYVFDPIIEAQGNKRLREIYGWMDGRELARQMIQDVTAASGGAYRPQIVETRAVDQHAYFTDGFQYTDTSYVSAHTSGKYHTAPFDYQRFLREHNLATRVDRGEIDEVWIVGPPGSGLYEVVMAGQGAYYMRGPAQAAGERAFPIMGLNYARSVGEGLLVFGHRVEATLAHIYRPLASEGNNAWRQFTRLHKDSPGQGGVGTADTPVNGRWGGDYNNRTAVQSTAYDWERYPALSGTKTSVQATEWSPSGADPRREYLNWWFDRLPNFAGQAADGRLANWWRYIADLDTFKHNLDLHGSDGSGKVWVTGVQNNDTVRGTITVGGAGIIDGVLGRIDLYVNGHYFGSDNLAPFTFQIDTSKLAGGRHTLQVRGIDARTNRELRSELVTIQVASTNNPPTLATIPTQYVAEGATLTFRAVGSDPDVGQKLTYSLVGNVPSGARIDPDTGVFTWSPTDGPSQSTSVQVRITDPMGASATQTVSIIVRNEAPTARFVSSGTYAVGRPITFSFLDATDASPVDRAAGFRYSFDFNNNGTFTDAGEVANSTSSSRTFTFNAPGTYTVRGRIEDKDGGGRDYRTTVTIGGSAGRVIDLVPGPGNSAPTQLLAIGKTLYFVATTPSTGEELFKTDGTAAGTVLVRDIMPGPGGSLPRNLTNVNGILYFTAQDPSGGVELWRSDGTAAGTRRVKDINPGTASSWPSKLTNHNGTLYFTAYTPENGVELWKSDGTEAGTVMVVDLIPGPGSSAPDQLTSFGSNLAFVGARSDTGSELFLTNGTAAGTVLVRDINPGRSSSFISGMVNANGTLFFSAYTPTHGQELWKSNGTSAGTMLVRDIAPGIDSSSPTGLVAVGSRVYFSANDMITGNEPWVSDGTAAGTRMLLDLMPGLGSSSPTQFTVFNGVVYFAATQSSTGIELWRTDGTTAGTRLVIDIQPGTASSSPEAIVVSGGALWFTAWTSGRGVEVWTSDGTAAGTKSFSTLYPGVRPTWPSSLVDMGGTLFFVAFEQGFGYELWSNHR